MAPLGTPTASREAVLFDLLRRTHFSDRPVSYDTNGLSGDVSEEAGIIETKFHQLDLHYLIEITVVRLFVHPEKLGIFETAINDP
jgi:hypothetical protein